MEVYIVRHGESTSNVGLSNELDCLLSPTGEKQADCLGAYLKDTHFDKIYSSHLTRAVQTAAAVAKHQPGKPEITVIPDFCETGTPADFEANTELHKPIYPNIRYVGTKISDRTEIDSARLQKALDKYIILPAITNTTEIEIKNGKERKKNPEKILIATHGCAIAILLGALVNFRFDVNMNVVQHNTCMNKVEIFLQDGIPRKRFLRYNDISHLPDELRLEGQF